MQSSKCPKCGKGVFQVESITPIGSNRDILCVICHSCSTTVGILDYLASGEEIKDANLQINVLNKKLEIVNQNISKLMNGMKLLYNKVDELKKVKA